MPDFRRSLPVLLIVIALLVGGAPAVANELDDALARQKELAAEIARQQAAMSALLKQQGSLKTQLAATRKALASTSANLAKIRALVAALDANLARVGRELAALDAQIREIDGEIARLDAAEAQKTRELAARMAVLRQRIREAYMAGRLPVVVGLLLDSGSLLSGTLDASLLTRLGEDDRRLAAEITAARAVITELEAAQRASRASAASLRSQSAARRADLAADLAEAAKNVSDRSPGPLLQNAARKARLISPSDSVGRFYVRIEVEDRPGVLAQVAGIFGAEKIGISSVLQPEGHGAGSVPLIFLLESALLSSLHRAVASIAKLPNTRAPATILRVEDLT